MWSIYIRCENGGGGGGVVIRGQEDIELHWWAKLNYDHR